MTAISSLHVLARPASVRRLRDYWPPGAWRDHLRATLAAELPRPSRFGPAARNLADCGRVKPLRPNLRKWTPTLNEIRRVFG